MNEMNEHDPANPLVTVIVVPRERFSCTKDSLESIIQYTTIPYKLIYIDGNSPPHIRNYIEQRAKEKNFQVIRKNYYLSPNQAPNIGWRKVNTKYLVFCDNDVIVTKGWLKAMVDCAESTGAEIVTPLTCQKQPVHEEIHCTGGVAEIREKEEDGIKKRYFVDQIHNQGKKVKDILPSLQREQTSVAEFHCVLARRDVIQAMNGLDEKMLNTKEHMDFSISIMRAGGKIFFEPQSIVTYLPGPPIEKYDLHFFMLRWSDDWEVKSLKHLIKKYDLTEDAYFLNRYRNKGWRRKMTIVRPYVSILHWRIKHIAEPVLMFLDKCLNKLLTTSHAISRSWQH